MGGTTLYCVVVLLVIVGLVSDGQQAHRKKTIDGRGVGASTFRAKPLATVNKPNHGIGHYFSNESRQVRKRHESKRFRAAMKASSLPLPGDPDSENNSGRKVIRVRSGNLGYFRIETPQWFRPVYESDVIDRYFHPQGITYGSIIVVSPTTCLISTHTPYNIYKTERIPSYALLMHSPNEVIRDKWIHTKPANGSRVTYRITLDALWYVGNGIYYFKIKSGGNFGNHVIKWTVNYNRHGFRRIGFPEDKYRRPDLGCFGFMYTLMKSGDEDVLVNTDYPVSIIEYKEGEFSQVYANDGPQSYGPYSRLKGVVNDLSPIFCGKEGSLRYIARQLNSTTKKLIPIHEIANEIKLAESDRKKSKPHIYYELVKMMRRRDRDVNEPGWTPDNVHPWWFLLLLRKHETTINGREIIFAGYLILLTRDYLLIPDHVARAALGPVADNDSYKSGMVIDNFRPLWPEPAPKFIHKIQGSQMSLYRRADGSEQGWRKEGLPKIQMGKDHSESNCNYLAHKLVGTLDDTDTRDQVKTPAFVIPDSCSQYFCYVLFDADKEPGVFEHLNPVMCEGYPAFILMDTKGGRPADRGRLALRIEYIMHRILLTNNNLFSELRDLSYEDQSGEPGELYPSKMIEVGRIEPPSWFRPMLNKSPNLGPLMDYAGSLVIVGPNKFVVADYVLNNALWPSQFTLFEFSDSKPDLKKKWIYETRMANKSPLVWSGWRLKDDYHREEDRRNYPKVNQFMSEIDMVEMTLEMGFGHVEPPSLRDYDPQKPISSLGDCYVYTYTIDDTDQLVFTEVPANIERCDDAYCYGPVNPFDARYDINQGVHAGAPVVCGTHLMFFNAPYPDHLNRAQFRVIHQYVVHSRIQGFVFKDVNAPNWYRILLSQDIIPPYPQNETLLAQAVVISDSFFIGMEEDVDAALELSAQRNNTTWMMFQTTDEPTPRSFVKLNLDDKIISGDVPLKRISLGQTGLAVYHRKPGHEQAGGGATWLSSMQFEKNSEPGEDCWVLIYRLDLGSGAGRYRLYKTKVSILNCKDGSCETIPNLGLFREGAPVVCNGYLAYIYGKVMLGRRPTAIRISWIYEQMKELDEDREKLQKFGQLSAELKMYQQEWYNKIRPYYPDDLGPPPPPRYLLPPPPQEGNKFFEFFKKMQESPVLITITKWLDLIDP